jgi:hypothetical protein
MNLIVKMHNLLIFGDKKFNLRIYDLIKQYNYLVIYLSEEIVKYKFSKKIYFDLYKKHFLFYTEIPTKAVNFNVNLYYENFLIEDEKNNIILLNNYNSYKEKEFPIPYYSFLIHKFKIVRYILGSEIFFIFSGKNMIYGLYGQELFINALSMCIKYMNTKYSKIFNNLYLFLNDEYNLSKLDNDILLIKNIDKNIKKISIISNFKAKNLKKNIDGIELRNIFHYNCSPNDTQQILDLIFKKTERKNNIKSSKKKNIFKLEMDTDDEIETSDNIFEEEDYYFNE